MSGTWPRSTWSEAGQVITFIGGSLKHDGKLGELADDPADYFRALVGQRRFHDAVPFMAHALPRFECLIWGAQTLLAVGAIDRNDPLVSATLRWIDDPGEHERLQLKAMADRADPISPAHMLAMAVFVAGGSIAEPGDPPVAAPANATAQYVACAILTATYDFANVEAMLDLTDDPDAIMALAAKPDAMLLQAFEIGEGIACNAA
jgi:hypothetical protein